MGNCKGCEKKKTNMKTMIANLTDDEILFCEKWEQVIKRKDRIDTSDIDYCYKLIFKQGLTSYCPQCLRDSASHLNNYFNTIREKYNTYKESKEKIVEEKAKPVTTPDNVVKEKVVTPKKQTTKKQPVKKKVVKKTSHRTTNKSVKKQ